MFQLPVVSAVYPKITYFELLHTTCTLFHFFNYGCPFRYKITLRPKIYSSSYVLTSGITHESIPPKKILIAVLIILDVESIEIFSKRRIQ